MLFNIASTFMDVKNVNEMLYVYDSLDSTDWKNKKKKTSEKRWNVNKIIPKLSSMWSPSSESDIFVCFMFIRVFRFQSKLGMIGPLDQLWTWLI